MQEELELLLERSLGEADDGAAAGESAEARPDELGALAREKAELEARLRASEDAAAALRMEMATAHRQMAELQSVRAEQAHIVML